MNSDQFEENLDLGEEVHLAKSLLLSRVYSVKIGGFGVSDGILAYYCSIPVQFLQSDISTFEQLTEDKSWPVSQLIQREIDRNRVREISKSYILKNDLHVKYFPPLTVAILPRDSDGAIAKEYAYSTEADQNARMQIYRGSDLANLPKAESHFLNSANSSVLKGLYLLNVSVPFDYNVLCWEKDKYYFVVIDGQHRFEALLDSMQRESLVGNFLQDVVFLDLSRVVHKTGESPVRAVRKVFLDINREAQRVTPVRQILMDDKDLAALLVQAIVNDDVINGKESNRYLKPQLIDWHGDGMKHSLPHLTGILLLHQLVSDSFLKKNLNSLDDLHNSKLVRDWVQMMNWKFDIDRIIDTNTAYIEVRKLADCLQDYEKKLSSKDLGDDSSQEVALFSFDYKVLDIARMQFEAIFLEAFLHIFENFSPYSVLREFVSQNGGFKENHPLSRALVMSPEKLRNKKYEKYSDMLVGLKSASMEKMKDVQFVFSVVFQRAIFELFIKRLEQDFVVGYNSEKALEVAKKVVNDLNKVFFVLESSGTCLFRDEKNVGIPKKFTKGFGSHGAVTSSFWEGLILYESRVVYNHQGIKSLSRLLEYMIEVVSLPEDGDPDTLKFDITGVVYRLQRYLTKNYIWEDDLDAKHVAQDAATGRQRYLNSLLQAPLKKQK